MNTLNISRILFVVMLIAVAACEINVDNVAVNCGKTDVSNYVAVGDSYTAGYTNGALSASGQQNSFATILAARLKAVGGGDFSIPLIPEGKSIGGAGSGAYRLEVTNDPGLPAFMPVPTAGNPELLSDPAQWISGLYHNSGVPGAKIYHLLAPELGSQNPFYARFASQPGVSSVIGDVMAQAPTFFSLWVGGNDVLSYALSGGEGDFGMGSNDVTEVDVFKSSLNALLSTLTHGGAKGVLGNIPNIMVLPFFCHISFDDLVLSQAEASQLTLAFEEYNQRVSRYNLSEIAFQEGRNAFVVEDDAHPLKMRQMVQGEMVLMSASSNILAASWGVNVPIPATYILDQGEVGIIETATADFNEILAGAASQYGLAFADINALVEKLKQGFLVDGNWYSSAFVSGGAFSLDGIHTCCRGSAIISNVFIEAINTTYNASIPKVNVNDYDGIIYP